MSGRLYLDFQQNQDEALEESDAVLAALEYSLFLTQIMEKYDL